MAEVVVPQRVKDQLDAVRDSGEANMMIPRDVQHVAARRGHYDLVGWIEDAAPRRGSGDAHPLQIGCMEGFVGDEEVPF